MKKTLVALVVLTSCTFGAYYDMGAGARSIGLGGSFTAIADDANAMYYNIAGIGQMKEMSFTGTYSSYFTGFYEGYAAFVFPVYKAGALGISWTDTVLLNPAYNENIITLGYSYPLAKIFYVGAGVRLFMKNYDLTALNANIGSSATGVAVCLSGFANINRDLTLGASFENINQPDVSLQTSDPVFSVYRVGASYKIIKDLTAAVQGDFRNGEVKASIGSEYWMDSRFLESLGIRDSSLAVRAGYVQGTSNLSNISAGFSFLLPVKFLDLRLDYSMTFPIGYVENANAHRITINISEPKPPHSI
ncbi:MAG: hypothetical protein WCK36_01970 [Candidatus Firestonebacteria bacterium]